MVNGFQHKPKPKPARKVGRHRFKIQRAVNVSARDRSNKKFLFGRYWKTVAEADHKPVAENTLQNLKHDQPGRTFRVAEVLASGNERVVAGPR